VHDDFTSLLKNLLLSQTDVSRLSALRRSISLFAQGEKAEALYFIEEGLVKLTRTNASARRLILSIYGPNDLLGEECLSGGAHLYHGEAEVLSLCTVYKIPWATVNRIAATHPELGIGIVQYLLDANLKFAHKIGLLCLQDVETRILYHLEELAKLVPRGGDLGYPLPITQLELADLVGATRETTSTTLNQLARRGLVKLSRRLLTVFPEQARAASVGGTDADS